MTRKNIFEILEEKYDIQHEYDVILNLFHSPILIRNYNNTIEPTTIENAINETCFYNWKQRGSCISIADMLQKLNFDSLDSSTLDYKIYQLEYFCNLIDLANMKLQATPNIPTLCYPRLDLPTFQKTPNMVILEKNIDLLLEHMNYEKHSFLEEEKVILIPKDPAITAAAEISSKSTAMAILKYHHASLKGQLAEKKDILRRIAQEYEPTLDNPIDGYTDYFKTATNMLNNLDIRHNNKVGKKKNDLVINLTNEELEKWYDELYQLLLFCILIKDNKERKDKMAEFLKGLKEKK